jgi:hypothetical protein
MLGIIFFAYFYVSIDEWTILPTISANRAHLSPNRPGKRIGLHQRHSLELPGRGAVPDHHFLVPTFLISGIRFDESG